MTTIRKLHDQWAARCLPKDAAPIQRQEMERAFYSGAFSYFNLTMVETATYSDAKAEQHMAALQKELEDYFRLMGTIPGPEGTQRQ